MSDEWNSHLDFLSERDWDRWCVRPYRSDGANHEAFKAGWELGRAHGKGEASHVQKKQPPNASL